LGDEVKRKRNKHVDVVVASQLDPLWESVPFREIHVEQYFMGSDMVFLTQQDEKPDGEKFDQLLVIGVSQVPELIAALQKTITRAKDAAKN
jgi:hypothetical protein